VCVCVEGLVVLRDAQGTELAHLKNRVRVCVVRVSVRVRARMCMCLNACL